MCYRNDKPLIPVLGRIHSIEIYGLPSSNKRIMHIWSDQGYRGAWLIDLRRTSRVVGIINEDFYRDLRELL